MSRVLLTRRRRRNPDAADKALAAVGVPKKHRNTAAIAAGAAMLGLAIYFGPKGYDRVTSGAKVGGASLGIFGTGDDAPAGGYLDKDPAELASTAGVPLDVYSLARVIRSEAGRQPAAMRIAVGWVVKNVAGNGSITALVTRGNAGGKYGAQDLGGRFVSTRFAPRQDDVALAEGILNGSIADNTGGAEHFFNPTLQNYLHKKLIGKYPKDAQAVIDGWARDGFSMRTIPGIDPDRFVVFVKGGGGLFS